MPPTVYFIEDQDALNSYIIEKRLSGDLGDCRLLAAETPTHALDWCRLHGEPVVFVVDSRLPLSAQLAERLEAFLQPHGIRLDQLPLLDVMVGTLATLLLRQARPDARIVVLSAFHRTIREVRGEAPVLDALLRQAVDVMVSKADPSDVTRIIKEQLAALGAATAGRQPTV
jgi:hypothetical protein